MKKEIGEKEMKMMNEIGEKEVKMKNEIGEKEIKMKNEKGTSTNTQVHTQTYRLRGEATYLCIV